MTLQVVRSWVWFFLVCGLIVIVFGGSVRAATTNDAIWAAQTFQRLAALDLVAVQEIFMNSDVERQWQQVTETVFVDSIHAAAFFEGMLWFPSEGPHGTWLVGLFNPWVSVMLILQFNDQITEIVAFHLISMSVSDIENASSDELQESILMRFAAAVSAFEQATSSWPNRGMPETDIAAWGMLSERLETYQANVRKLLAADGLSVWQDARYNLTAAREDLSASKLSGAYKSAGILPLPWRQTAIPVWASENSDSMNVVLTSASDPFWLLWLQVKARSHSDPLDQAVVIDVLESFKQSEGGAS